jgi:pimeloyl-ACP methyl ester carboxylesterase
MVLRTSGAPEGDVARARDAAVRAARTWHVYGTIGGATRLLGMAAEVGVASRAERDARSLSMSPRGALVLGVLNGLIGDRLEEEGSDLQEPMSVRLDGRPVELDPGTLAATFPDARPRLVVFLHGLMESEFAWRIGAGPAGATYGSRLRDELGYTPLELRYNTGRHISDNGRSLADLLAELTDAWPVEMEELALVGHSMGGLVARSGCYQGSERGDPWTERVRHVISLGTPHMGAPLAQGVHWAAGLLHAVPETRTVAGLLRRRSAGIRDLRQASLVDEDWRDRDPDALAAVACREVPLLDGATHCFVAATVTRSPRHPVARLIGDWLVLEPSASGRSRARRIPFEAEHGMHLGGTNHIALLNHPAVYEQLRRWLSERGPR